MANEEARSQALGDTAQLRLESDARAVQIATIHKSKGLEYPIVYCPFLWDTPKPQERDHWVRFHDGGVANRLTVDLGTERLDAHRARAAEEAWAEGVRLLYVALTRSKHRCVAVWGPISGIERSALGYLLHSVDPSATAGSTGERIRGLAVDELRLDLQTLVDRSRGCIGIAASPAQPAKPFDIAPADGAALARREPSRVVRRSWSQSSFSHLVGSAPYPEHPSAEGIDRDEQAAAAPDDELPRPAAADARVRLAGLPSGTAFGLLVHDLFENLDFCTATTESLCETASHWLAQYGLDGGYAETLARGVADTLQTPLPLWSGEGRMRLADIPCDARLNEMEILLPVARGTAARRPLSAKELAKVLQQHASDPAVQRYVPRLRELEFAPVTGFMRGFVDMVFAHGGRWYLIDYKSNHLGDRVEDYGALQVEQAMAGHHYFLQYHIYALALHRYLKQRLPEYRYEAHFGGVHYLFLRGMAPEHPEGRGVFAERPPEALLEAMGALFAQGAEGRGG